jgi:hypothetical protein
LIEYKKMRSDNSATSHYALFNDVLSIKTY